uniref:serine--tRNA ligase n=1 Tax=Graphocephala atropunctata TaxID=36148 RepID=A0A1B6M1D8_9HEMI
MSLLKSNSKTCIGPVRLFLSQSVTNYNCKQFGSFKNYSRHNKYTDNCHFPSPILDESYLCDQKNKEEIKRNIIRRKGVGDIEKVLQLHGELSAKSDNESFIRDSLMKEMLKIPNRTHPDILNYGDMPNIVKSIGDKKSFNFKPKEFHIITKQLNVLKNDTSNFTGHRSYFFSGQLAELESALIKYFMSKLLHIGFQAVSVPDILERSIIESCGMETQGIRSQVYSLSPKHYESDKCLSGTAEMALAAYLMNKELSEDELPLRLAAVSRCFRAETSRTADERGIYRVHQFTKVEMFGVSEPEKSSELLEEFREFEEEQFASLGLHLRVLDMPPHELGAQAFRKYDVEAWLPGRQIWAELSSCSDCTDYQSRRLAIRCGDRHLHTVNGTACAVPRLVIALFETHQQSDGSVLIPPPLQPFMGNATVISRDSTKHIPRLRPIKRLTQKS